MWSASEEEKIFLYGLVRSIVVVVEKNDMSITCRMHMSEAHDSQDSFFHVAQDTHLFNTNLRETGRDSVKPM